MTLPINPILSSNKIEMEEVQVGDYVQIVYHSKFDSTFILVDHKSENYLHSSHRSYLIPPSIPVEIYLVSRPRPDLPITPGSVIRDVVTQTGTTYPILFLINQKYVVGDPKWIDPNQNVVDTELIVSFNK